MPNDVPVVDVRPLIEAPESAGSSAAIATIADACRRHGFFQVVGHGFDGERIAKVWRVTREFFALPRERKLELSRTRENPRGYYDRELTKNRRDLKEVFDFGMTPHPELPDEDPRNRSAVDGFNVWPGHLPEFRETQWDYLRACERVGFVLLEAFCRGLGVPATALHDAFRPVHTSFARLNYYPLHDPLDAATAASVTPLGDMALHHHTDAGALTILLQDDAGGLQVAESGTWIDVPPVDGALVINLGDMMQVWSNDTYRAALHRVLPRHGRERYSIPFFFNPSYETDIAPLPDVAGAPRYRTVNWGEFRQARTDGDYADYGHEIQIADFRVRD